METLKRKLLSTPLPKELSEKIEDILKKNGFSCLQNKNEIASVINNFSKEEIFEALQRRGEKHGKYKKFLIQDDISNLTTDDVTQIFEQCDKNGCIFIPIHINKQIEILKFGTMLLKVGWCLHYEKGPYYVFKRFYEDGLSIDECENLLTDATAVVTDINKFLTSIHSAKAHLGTVIDVVVFPSFITTTYGRRKPKYYYRI